MTTRFGPATEAVAALERLAGGRPSPDLSEELLSSVTEIRDHVETLATSAGSLSSSSWHLVWMTGALLVATLALLGMTVWSACATFDQQTTASTIDSGEAVQLPESTPETERQEGNSTHE